MRYEMFGHIWNMRCCYLGHKISCSFHHKPKIMLWNIHGNYSFLKCVLIFSFISSQGFKALSCIIDKQNTTWITDQTFKPDLFNHLGLFYFICCSLCSETETVSWPEGEEKVGNLQLAPFPRNQWHPVNICNHRYHFPCIIILHTFQPNIVFTLTRGTFTIRPSDCIRGWFLNQVCCLYNMTLHKFEKRWRPHINIIVIKLQMQV